MSKFLTLQSLCIYKNPNLKVASFLHSFYNIAESSQGQKGSCFFRILIAAAYVAAFNPGKEA